MKIIGIICLLALIVSGVLTAMDDYDKSEEYYDE